MHATRWLAPGLLVVLSVGLAAGLFATRDRAAKPEAEAPGEGAGGAAAAGPAAGPPAEAKGTAAADPTARPARRERPFDLQPLLTARRVASLAEGPEEVELARQAERLADHAVDLAFAETLQQILDEPPPLTPELRSLTEARARAQAATDAAAARVEQLSREEERAPGDSAVAARLEVAKAQVELARDELTDAGERLGRAGGDPQARIQRLRAAYDAAQKTPAAAAPAMPSPAPGSSASVLACVRAWLQQRGKGLTLESARQEALDRVARLERRTERVTKRIDAEAREREPQPAVAAGAQDEAARAEAIRRLARDRRRLTGIGRRLQDQQELADVYADWRTLAAVQARGGLHRVLATAGWVLVALVLMWAAGRLIDRVVRREGDDVVRAGTLRGVIRIAVQLVGTLVILFIVLGVPGQATTILGLAGAGLTVALKDFIVAFFGWFVLMGRNGIRVGDWVEIKGVGGEVAEIGLIHTVLLETGSWSDAGHPTGRRVSFVNSFAIEGHYFNFTTSGQWMWDALQLVVPLGQDPYPVIDGIQRLVERETEANGKLAEQEWTKAASRYRVRTFAAVPGINVVPTSTGVQLDVRFITRVHERHETRRRLYQAVVELMHGRREKEVGAA